VCVPPPRKLWRLPLANRSWACIIWSVIIRHPHSNTFHSPNFATTLFPHPCAHEQRAHALTPFLTSTSPAALPSFPFLTLLVSGGHTLLVLATGPAAFRTLATTVDESIGRAFDKVARLLGLEWAPSLGPGAALERFCAEDGEDGVAGDDQQLHVPPLSVMPSVLPGKLAFSYAGLHSIVERYVTGWQQQHNKQQREHAAESATTLPTRTRRALGRAFQTAAVAQLEEKLLLALELCAREHVAVRHVVVSGGVASNNFLRQRSVLSILLF
jgi:N6-L-threonylcarbamoyladenine synthase